VLVADRENNRIQVFAPDGSYVTEFGGLFRPCGLCLDGAGNIYVAELGPSHGQVSILDPNGNLTARWDIKGEIPSAGGHSIAVDSEGSIYVGLVYQGFPPPEDAHPVIKYRRT
jgi:DNA-binding beta-propeller fold protein YncE